MSNLDKKQQIYGISGKGEIQTFLMRFTQADLLGNILVVEHRLNVEFPIVAVYNELNQIIEIDPYGSVGVDVIVSAPDSNKILLDFTGFAPLPGLWHVRVIGA